MSLSDPIGDMIARIKNAQSRSHKKVELPSSSFKTKIAGILKNEGFIKEFKVNSDNNKSILTLELKYHSGSPGLEFSKMIILSFLSVFLSLIFSKTSLPIKLVFFLKLIAKLSPASNWFSSGDIS